MSYTRTLDELDTRSLQTELEHRAAYQRQGRCDYCYRTPDTKPCKFPERHRGEIPVTVGPGRMHDELVELVRWMDDDLDGEVAERYRDQPLAQDWARVAKVGEEAGEAIDALIGVTGQNPRKGHYGSRDDLLAELADVALTGLYAIQHFTKNGTETLGLLMDRARYHRTRREEQLTTDRIGA